MTARRPYKPGDVLNVWHTCSHHAPALSALRVTTIERVTDGHRRPVGQQWRVCARRCDGSLLELLVRTNGRDEDGYAAPAGVKPPLATTNLPRDPMGGGQQLDVFELLSLA